MFEVSTTYHFAKVLQHARPKGDQFAKSLIPATIVYNRTPKNVWGKSCFNKLLIYIYIYRFMFKCMYMHVYVYIYIYACVCIVTIHTVYLVYKRNYSYNFLEQVLSWNCFVAFFSTSWHPPGPRPGRQLLDLGPRAGCGAHCHAAALWRRSSSRGGAGRRVAVIIQ